MSNEGERLQLGREKRRRPAGSGNAPDYPEDAGAFARFRYRRRQRRAATKARVAAMSGRRRFARRSMILGTWLLGFIAAGMVAVDRPVLHVHRRAAAGDAAVSRWRRSSTPTVPRWPGSAPRTARSCTSSRCPTRAVGRAGRRGPRLLQRARACRSSGTVRAALTDVTGGDTQGGSGITQQYVKNAYLNNAHVADPQAQGADDRGEADPRLLQGPDPRVLPQHRLLRPRRVRHPGRRRTPSSTRTSASSPSPRARCSPALLRAPELLRPGQRPDPAQQRWRYVTDGMVKTKHLTAAQEAALTFPKTIKPPGQRAGQHGLDSSLIVNQVLAELQAHGISEAQVNKQGLTIRTTIDKKAQNAAVTAITTTFAGLTKKQTQPEERADRGQPGHRRGARLLRRNRARARRATTARSTTTTTPGAAADRRVRPSSPTRWPPSSPRPCKQARGQAALAINSIVDGSYKKKIDGR